MAALGGTSAASWASAAAVAQDAEDAGTVVAVAEASSCAAAGAVAAKKRLGQGHTLVEASTLPEPGASLADETCHLEVALEQHMLESWYLAHDAAVADAVAGVGVQLHAVPLQATQYACVCSHVHVQFLAQRRKAGHCTGCADLAAGRAIGSAWNAVRSPQASLCGCCGGFANVQYHAEATQYIVHPVTSGQLQQCSCCCVPSKQYVVHVCHPNPVSFQHTHATTGTRDGNGTWWTGSIYQDGSCGVLEARYVSASLASVQQLPAPGT